jgi:hypothetical protein
MVLLQRSRREPGASLAALLLSCLTFLDTANAISRISANGTKLFDEDGNQFFIQGVCRRGLRDAETERCILTEWYSTDIQESSTSSTQTTMFSPTQHNVKTMRP